MSRMLNRFEGKIIDDKLDLVDGKLISNHRRKQRPKGCPSSSARKMERKKTEEERRGKDGWSGSLLAQENPVINSRKKR